MCADWERKKNDWQNEWSSLLYNNAENINRITNQWVEMSWKSHSTQKVTVPKIGLIFILIRGETWHFFEIHPSTNINIKNYIQKHNTTNCTVKQQMRPIFSSSLNQDHNNRSSCSYHSKALKDRCCTLTPQDTTDLFLALMWRSFWE